MKKLIYCLVIVLLMVLILPLNVKAEELVEDNSSSNEEVNDNNTSQDEIINDSTIIKFDYYPGGSLSKERELTFEWISIEKMDTLSILVFNPNLKNYVEVFDLSWDLEDVDSTFDVKFEIIDEPIDDPLTPDIDETKDKLWEYKLTFKLAKDTYGLLKFKFIYTCGLDEYENLFYLPNVVYPSVVVPPTPPKPDDNKTDEKDDNDGYFTTSNALIAAIFATICSVVGTLLIIFSSQHRKFYDEVIK